MRAGGVQRGDLRRGQVPADGAEVLAQLLLVARADDHGRHGRPLEQPVERDLRHGLAGLPGDRVEGVDDPVEVLVGHLRPDVGRDLAPQAARLRQRLAAADLAGQPAPAERAPDDRADLLVEGQRHQLPLVVAADQRVVRLVGDVAGEAVPLGDGQRLHQVPAGEVRAADVADLAGPDQVVERAQHLLDRRQRVEAVQLEEVDVVGAQPPAGSPRPPGSGGGATSRRRWARGRRGTSPLVEMSTWSRRPLIAWPRISSAIPPE